MNQKTNPVLAGKLRFTVLDEVCIRIEYCENGRFCDDPTLFASNRDLRYGDFTCEEKDGILTIATKSFTLTWQTASPSPRSGSLKITCGKSVWRWGSRNRQNLGAAVQSLDGCSGPIRLEEGLLSRDGWQVIDDTGKAILKDNWIAPRPKGGDNDFDLYYFGYGKEYRKALKALAKISGNVPLIPRFLMGSWYSRWYHYTSQDYRNIVREYHDNGFPLDNIVMDMEWHTREGKTGFGWAGTLGWTGWNWNRELLPDAEKLLEEFREQGLHVAMNVHPADGIRTHEHCYPAFMRALGEDPAEGKDLPFDDGSRAYMEAWYLYAHAPYEKQGCSIWWVDWQQDCIYPWVKGVPGTRHVPWLNACYYRHMSTEGRRGISFSRWGGWGDQKHPIHFSGDTSARWEVLAFQIAFTQTSGNALCFFWSHDMGGFCGKRNEELYARWLQFGSVSAAMRLHSAGNDLDRRPWKWETVFRESMRKSFHRRAQLMPYVYTAMRNACRDSVPMIRPLYIDHPEDENAYRNMGTFLLGDDLLVSPVTAPGDGPRCVAVRTAYFPGGTWFRTDSGECFPAGEHAVGADIDELPLFVRDGFPLVLAPAETDRLACRVTDYEIMLFSAGEETEQTFVLYEDDGVTDAWQRGAFAETRFRALCRGTRVQIRIGRAEGTYQDQAETRTFSLCLRNVKKVLSVLADGNGIPFRTEETFHTLRTEKITLRTDQEMRLEAEVEWMDPETIRQEARMRRTAECTGDAMKKLLSGAGAFADADPLTGKKFVTVLPGMQRVEYRSVTQGTVLEGSLEVRGTAPFRLPWPEEGDQLELTVDNVRFRFPVS